MRPNFSCILVLLAGSFIPPLLGVENAVPDFSAVFRIIDERCLECHAAEDFEGGLVLESHEQLMKGGESGAAIVPGKSAESLLVKYLRGEVEKDGKKKFMPPGKREKLSAEEIQLVTKWIDAGARPPLAGPEKPREINVPKVVPKVAPRDAVYALAFSPAAKLIAVGRYGVIELLDATTRAAVRKLEGHKGNVNALVFSEDGTQLFAASGENALFGEVKQWNVADGQLRRTIQGHRDTLYALALSPDGRILATAGYDQQIKLWDAQTGAELKTLRGHNGAVYAVAFRPDGKLLASASADRTVKLWDVATGQRRDTLSQPTKEQVTLAWSRDGQRLAAGGFDNRIRVWQVSAEAKETTNPLVIARFAHEQPILRIVWSADGQTIASSGQDGALKLWDAAEVKERLVVEKQPDWASALAFLGNGALLAGRLDGGLVCYDAATGLARVAAGDEKKTSRTPLMIPTIKGVEPRGVQRGVEITLKVRGTNLAGVNKIKFSDQRVTGEMFGEQSTNEVSVALHTPPDLPRGNYDFTIVNESGQSSGVAKIVVDDLPQLYATEKSTIVIDRFPVSIWGALEKPGATDRLEFQAKAGQTLVFDLASKSLGAKGDAVLSLTDANGHVLASNNDYDGSGDPLIAYTFNKDGLYALIVSDVQFGGSPDYFYRLSAGELPFVTACFPLSLPPNAESEVQLIGFNLPAVQKIKVKSGAVGEVEVSLDEKKFRSRRAFKLLVSDLAQAIEAEPNDTAEQANPLIVPGSINGRLTNGQPTPVADVDYYRFEAKKDSKWAIETQAAQRGSPADTKIEVLYSDGQPIERLLLQAVRDSAITFRGIDSATNDVRVENWREMDLNQLLFVNGEVAKIFRMPEGPDSGFQFYSINGKRQVYFNTTATAHSLDEPCYIVEPHPPGTHLISNGLPSFPIYYANDDDGERQLGTDSRVLFTAPADGTYVVRVSDSRGLNGNRFLYRLVVRQAQPDFSISVSLANAMVNRGSGQSFTVNADRKDGFDGEIAVEITGVPDGFTLSTPLLIEGGHQAATGTLFALPNVPTPPGEDVWRKLKVNATATIEDKKVTRSAPGFGSVKLGEAPKVYVALEPAASGDTLEHLSASTPLREQDPGKPWEITIAPGESIPAWMKVKRNGENADLRFDVENLPHGIIVDNLGLNGITLLAGQNEGEITIKAARWVKEMDRLCYAVTREAGKQTSLPVMLHVRKKDAVKSLEVK